jgi:hypothetical protein
VTTGYVKNVLQEEIIAALKTSPLAAFLNTTSPYVGAYPSSRLDQPDGYDPKCCPAIFVDKPKEDSTESMCPNFMKATYKVALYLYFEDERDTRAADTMGKITNAIRVVLAANSFTTNMRRLGSYPNAAVVVEEGWGNRGQSKCYKLMASYTLMVPSDELVTL